ncbi:uncharacterized protein LOC106659482 [Trichogramma pretiosum]|uniref:uncharacterized protein LOC106659482 n=1 Tax=Trichogramma pretiosum TaxID=7493 RepID=UPI000C71C153|nr:uncharacterized protein LOC106659482 [Trichogramma pretiosum]
MESVGDVVRVKEESKDTWPDAGDDQNFDSLDFDNFEARNVETFLGYKSSMVVLMDSDAVMAIRMLVISCATLTVMLFMCVPGQFLSDASNELFTECYCVDWHGYHPKARMLLALILVRTMKPFILRAGFLADMSFETFSSIIKVTENTKEYGFSSSLFIEDLFQVIASLMMIYVYPFMIWKYDRSYEKSNRFSLVITMLFIPITVTFAFAPLVIPILSTQFLPGNQTFQKALPLHVEFFVDEEKYFYHLFALQFITIMIYFTIIGGLNTFLYSGVGFIVGELQYLQYYLEKTDSCYSDMVSECRDIAYNFLTKSLVYFIQQHQRCIKLYEILYFVTESMMFVTMLGTSTSLIIACSAMVVLMDSDESMASKMLVLCIASLSVILFICVPGQFLSDAGNELFTKCYCVDWHGYPPKARILLVLILVRTMKPMELKAGFLAVLSFETFSSVLKKSMSFVTAFRSIYATL